MTTTGVARRTSAPSSGPRVRSCGRPNGLRPLVRDRAVAGEEVLNEEVVAGAALGLGRLVPARLDARVGRLPGVDRAGEGEAGRALAGSARVLRRGVALEVGAALAARQDETLGQAGEELVAQAGRPFLRHGRDPSTRGDGVETDLRRGCTLHPRDGRAGS